MNFTSPFRMLFLLAILFFPFSLKSAAAAPVGVLNVSPQESFQSSGNQGGPFSPSSKEFTLFNIGSSSLNYTVSTSESWTSVSSASGTIAGLGSTIVTVSLNSNADSLLVGQHTDTISFTNTTNGN